MKDVKNYFSLVKFSHTLFAMPFAFIGFFLAVYEKHIPIDWTLLLLMILCMVFARNAAMAFNRYIDREIDAKNPRTILREIPAGIIAPKSALKFVAINSALFIITTAFINPLTLKLSPIALLVILGYSLTKRYTALCHFVLGLGLSLAPLGAYLTVTGAFDILPVILSLIVLLWTTGFDIIYALQDEEFDKNEDLKSIPVKLGRKYSMWLSSLLHIIVVALIILFGVKLNAGLLYWIGAVVFSLFILRQHTIINIDNLSKINIAFFTLNGLASVIYATITIISLILN